MPHIHSSPQSIHTIYFPDELIDFIFQLLDDSTKHSPKPTLKACSLVCKQWHRVVLPHLFRSISLNGSHDLEEDVESFLISPCAQFFTGNPDLTARVQYLKVEHAEMNDTHVLDTLLGIFPSLREVELASVVTGGHDYDEDGDDVRCRSHAIDVLTFTDEACYRALEQCDSFVRFLSLFSRIGELRVDAGGEVINRWPSEAFLDTYVEDVHQTLGCTSGTSHAGTATATALVCISFRCI